MQHVKANLLKESNIVGKLTSSIQQYKELFPVYKLKSMVSSSLDNYWEYSHIKFLSSLIYKPNGFTVLLNCHSIGELLNFYGNNKINLNSKQNTFYCLQWGSPLQCIGSSTGRVQMYSVWSSALNLNNQILIRSIKCPYKTVCCCTMIKKCNIPHIASLTECRYVTMVVDLNQTGCIYPYTVMGIHSNQSELLNR